jgi:hypothetical protein
MAASIGRISHELGFLSVFSGFPPVFFGFPNGFPDRFSDGKTEKGGENEPPPLCN